MAPDLQVGIEFEASGGKDAAKEIDRINKSAAAVRLEIDQFKAGGGIGALAIGQERIDEAAAKLSVLRNEALNAAARIVALNQELGDVNRTRPFNQITDEIERTELRAATLRKEMSLLTKDLREGAADAVGSFGDVDSALAQIGGSLSGLGTSPIGRLAGGGVLSPAGALAPIGAGFQAGSDVFAIAEALPRLSTAFQQVQAQTVSYIATAGAQASANSALAATASATVAPLGSTAAGLAAMVVSAAPLIAATAAIGGGFLALKKVLEDGVDAAKENAEAQREAIERSRRLRELQGQSFDDLASRASELETNIQEEITARDNLIRAESDAIAETDDFGLTLQLFAKALPGANTRIEEATDQINSFNDSIEQQAKELEDINNLLNRAEMTEIIAQAGEAAVDSTEDQIAAIQERIQAEQQFAEDMKTLTAQQVEDRITANQEQVEADQELFDTLAEQLAEAQRQFEGETDAIELTRLDAEIKVLTASMDEATVRINEASTANQRLEAAMLPAAQAREAELVAIEATEQALEALSAKRDEVGNQLADVTQELEDLAAAEQRSAAERQRYVELEQAQADELGRLNAQLQQAQTVKNLRDQQAKIVEARQTAAQKEVEAVRKAQDNIRSLLQKANLQSIKLVSDFQKESLRSQRDFNNDRLDAQQDAELSLFEAALENNVNSFLQTQRRFSVDDQRARRDFSIGQGDEQQDLGDRLAEIKAQTDAEVAERRAGQAEIINNIRQQTAETVANISDGSKRALTEVERIQLAITRAQQRFTEERAQLQQDIERETAEAHRRDLENQQRLLQGDFERYDSQLRSQTFGLGASVVNGLLSGVVNQANQQVQQITQSFAPSVNVSAQTNASPEQIAGVVTEQLSGYTRQLSRTFRLG